MARLKSIAIGPGIGSAGDATYRSVRGRTIMSARVKQNASNTIAQESQRYKFKSFVESVTKDLWWPRMLFAKTKYGSRRNNFVKSNSPIIFDNANPHNMENWAAEVGAFTNFVEGIVSGESNLSGFYLSRGAAPYVYSGTLENANYQTLEVVCTKAALSKVANTITLVGGSFNAVFAGRSEYYAAATLALVEMPISAIESLEVSSEDATETTWATLYASGTCPYYIGADKMVHICLYVEGITEIGGTEMENLLSIFKTVTGRYTEGDITEIPFIFYDSPTTENTQGFMSLLINGEPVTFRYTQG